MGTLWIIVVVVGPILLGLAIVWGLTRNRTKRSAGDVARTEAATHQLYDELNEQDARGEAR